MNIVQRILADAEARAADKPVIDIWRPAEKHYGPGKHPGTGTPQSVHGGGEEEASSMRLRSVREDDLYTDEDDDEGGATCPICGGPGVALGSLGSRAHYRCRNCGMDFSHDTGRSGFARRQPYGEPTKPKAATGTRPLSQIARDIRKNWPNVNFGAKPYLDALGALESIDDNYYADSGRSVVAYFLSNARTWKGPEAKRIKAELNAMLKRR